VRTAIIAAALLAVLAAPSRAAEVQVTSDSSADITRYPTFSFLQSDPKAKGAINDKMVRERLQYMIAMRLNALGYKPAPPGKTGELGVHITGEALPKQRVLMVGRPGPHDYSWGRTELGGTSTMDYREGDFAVDLVDIEKGRLLWRARIKETLTTGYSEENWKKAEKALAQAFAKLPARRP
jgi:hypothetical protein